MYGVRDVRVGRDSRVGNNARVGWLQEFAGMHGLAGMPGLAMARMRVSAGTQGGKDARVGRLKGSAFCKSWQECKGLQESMCWQVCKVTGILELARM